MVRRHYFPFVKTLGATLWASVQVIGRDLVGTPTPEQLDDILNAWSDRVFRIGAVNLTSIDSDRYEDARPVAGKAGAAYVVMTNHQSLLDIPAVVSTFPGRVRMVGKRELSKVPVWGKAMKAGGIVFVDRDNREQSIAALELAKAQLQQGTSIWIAPEGTRGPPGELLPLKKGGFHVATQLGVPIAPAWITGTADIIAPDSFGVLLHGTVTVRYGAPIATDGVALPDLMEQVRTALLALQAASTTS